jgi:ubiquinone/menaquinone biosynthesis C-methylase UbiE
MTELSRHTDYDQIAPTFDQRYERNDYGGVARLLREFIGNERGLRLLEVGCGTGHWLEVVQESENHVIGLDFSAGMLARARSSLPGMALIRGTADYIPLPGACLDRVFCINAMHHFPDKPAFLREARRILRPGGRLLSVGLDPHRGLDRWHVYDYFPESLAIDRQRYPATDVLREWMRIAGFEDCVTQEAEHWTIQIPARAALAQGRLDQAATSQLSVLTEAEYQQGMQRIRAELQRLEAARQTLFLTIDLRLYGTIGSAG